MNDLTASLFDTMTRLAKEKGRPAPKLTTTAEKIAERASNPKLWTTEQYPEGMNCTADPDYTPLGN